MEKRWQKSEIAHLEKYAGSRSAEELAKKLKTDAATVRKKIAELKLKIPESGSQTNGDALKAFEEAMKLLHEQQWAAAAERFEPLVDGSNGRHLADRARQFLAICEQKQAEAVSPSTPYLQAVIEKNRGNYEAALAICGKHGNKGEEDGDGRYAYLAASLEALHGNADAAIERLSDAVRLDPKNRVHAYHDPDFEAIRKRQEFVDLVFAGT